MQRPPSIRRLLTWRLPPKFLGAAAAIGLAALVVVLGALCTSAPVDDSRPRAPGPPAVTLLTADGEPFASRGALRAAPVEVSALPPYVPAAFVAIEDRRFYRHHGVDLQGVVRAALADLKAGAAAQGGSTITEQLVKNTILGPRQTLSRKLRESVLALKLERRLSKGEILSRYLSTAYFGEGAYGLGAAARNYFEKSPEELTLGEAALLAGLVKAPSDLAPHSHPAAAWARAQVVLRAMVATKQITPAEWEAVEPPQLAERANLGSFGGYFADWLYPAVAAQQAPAYGSVAVRTTLDRRLQQHAEAVVREALETYGPAGRADEAALVAMRADGSVVAMIGGRDYTASPFNRAVQARRQPGSTFKLFAYLAALREGAAPETLVSDDPFSIGGWQPRNADRQSHGTMTLEEAFATSNNVAAVRLGQAVGIPKVVRAARDLGLSSRLEAVPSLPLGVSSVSLLELTAAYAAVAAGAYPVRPAGFPALQGEGQRTMDPAVREGMLRLLGSAAQHAGAPISDLPFEVYGKTGTSQGYRDALFVGFVGDLIVGVWVGNDRGEPMNRVYGGALPARIWADFVAAPQDRSSVAAA